MSKFDFDDYDEYDDNIEDKIEERHIRKKKKGIGSNGKWGIALVIELIVVVLLGYGIFRNFVHDKYQKFDHVKDMKKEELDQSKELLKQEEEAFQKEIARILEEDES